jgi:hypothetical protein
MGSNSSSQDLLEKIARKPDVILEKVDGTIYLGYAKHGTPSTASEGWAISKIVPSTTPEGDTKTITTWASGNPDYYGHVFDQYETFEYKFPV